MAEMIQDGTGTGSKVKIDAGNRMKVHAITEDESLHSIEAGDAYNINTGMISVTGDATLVYIKNNEVQPLLVESIAMGSFEGITHSDDPYLVIVRNPTGGDLITDATSVSMNQNRDFGTSKTLLADTYKGKVGGTMTGGDDLGFIQMAPGGRSFFPIGLSLSQGSSLGIKMIANASSGSANYYAALVCYKKDANLADA